MTNRLHPLDRTLSPVILAPARNPDEVAIQLASGGTWRLSARIDERVKHAGHFPMPTVLAVSETACDELIAEARAWGVTGVRFGVAS